MDDRQINRYLSLMQTPTSECNRDVKWEELWFHMIFFWEKKHATDSGSTSRHQNSGGAMTVSLLTFSLKK